MFDQDPRLGDLSFCVDLDPRGDWKALRDALAGPAMAMKQSVSPGAPFPLGLRVSASALGSLEAPEQRAELNALIGPGIFRALTANGLSAPSWAHRPQQASHLPPDWLSDDRLDYTCALADLMADLVTPGGTVSLSTAPGALREIGLGREGEIAARLIRAAAHCVKIRRRTGVTVAIAIEPEPYWLLETTAETAAFLTHHLFTRRAEAMLAQLTGLSGCGAAMALRRHLGLCYDTCHAALMFEDASASIAALRAGNVPVHKLQLSAALRIASVDGPSRAAAAAFAETHAPLQVVCRRDGAAPQLHPDLATALARGDQADGEEWRIRFQAPLAMSGLGPFETTSAFVEDVLALHRTRAIAPHLEIETALAEIAPSLIGDTTIEEVATREIGWVIERLSDDAGLSLVELMDALNRGAPLHHAARQ
ncbi:MAG: hypothetical protein AAF899_04840 [Pseudomonadota bacterium]